MLEDLKFDKTCRHYVVKKIVAIAIRTFCYVFCQRNKEWDDPALMKFGNFSSFSCIFRLPLYLSFIFVQQMVNYLFREVCICMLVFITRNEVGKKLRNIEKLQRRY